MAYNLRKICKLANYLVRHYRCPAAVAFQQSWKVAKLIQNLHNSEWNSFAYFKKDGSIRVALGTLLPSAIHINFADSEPKSHPSDVIRYYDVEAQQFRSFKALNLI